MKAVFYMLLLGAIGVLVFQLVRQYREEGELRKQAEAVSMKTEPLAKENERMQADIASLDGKEAMLRELRRQGYAAPGEKVFVIVPKR